MKTYIYQDEKSHKFWAVEQQENELHISWGGTVAKLAMRQPFVLFKGLTF
ncbi:hypothetical protein JFK50_18340, partial [Escherichia coli]|nr:hypothetical protein [Escherichia coli]